MRRKIITMSVFAAAFASAAFTDRGMWLPALGCIGWMVLVLYASTRKKPRAATRSRDSKPIPLYSYSKVRDGWRQAFDERWYT